MATSPMGLPFELQGEQSQLDRKQAIMQALLGSLMAPRQGQMISGHYVGGGLAGALAPVAGAFLGNRFQEKNTAARQALAEKYNTGLGTAMRDYFNTRTGTPGETLNDKSAEDLLVNDNNPGMLNDGSAADPRRAAVQALTSGYAPLHELGKTDLTELSKEALQDHKLAAAAKLPNKGMSSKEIFSIPGASVESRLAAAMSGDLSGIKAELKEHSLNGQLVGGRPETGYRSLYDARDRFGETGLLAPGVMGVKNLATNEPKYASNGTTVNVDATQGKAGNKFAEKLAEGRAGAITKSYESAQSAAKAIDAIGAAQADFSAGIKSGITGNIALGLSKFGKALGLPDDPTIANTEAYRANMARETLNLVKGLGSGTGISNADREFAEKASGGAITLDDKAMLRLMNVAKAAAANVIRSHGTLLDRNKNASGALPDDLATFEVPLNVYGGDGFGYDETLRKFISTDSGAGSPRTTGKGPLTPSEQTELQRLRQQFGRR